MSLQTKLIPELCRFETASDRRKVVTQSLLDLQNDPQILLGLVLMIAGQVLGMYLVGLVLSTWFSVSQQSIVEMVLDGAVCGLASILFILPVRTAIRKSIRCELRRRGATICIDCGYDIRGQTIPRCPECGTPFDSERLTVGEREDSQ